MTEQQLAQWLQALRSGRYTQEQRKLENPRSNSYCCLGVLNLNYSMPMNYAFIESLLPEARIFELIDANDEGPLDNYNRVLWLLESAPELFLTAPSPQTFNDTNTNV